MSAEVASAIISGAAALGSAGIGAGSAAVKNKKSYKYTKKLNKQMYEYNKDLSERAFKQNVRLWREENAYNTPAAQMARMRAAGLNPNLIYGNGQEASAGLAGDAPNLQYGDYNPKVPVFESPLDAVGNGINVALDSSRILSMISQANAAADNLEADTQLKLKNYEWIDEEKRANIDKKKAETVTQEYMQGNYQALTDQAMENCRKLSVETKTLWKQFNYIDRVSRASLDLTAAEISEINERTKNYPVQRAKLRVEMSTLVAQARYLATASNLNDQQAMELGQRMYESMSRIDNIIADTGLKGREADALKGEAFRRTMRAITGSVHDLATSYSAIMGVPQINLTGPGTSRGATSLYPSMESNPWMVEY